MCGRFTLKAPPEEIARMLGLDLVPNLQPRYNIAPGQEVLALRLDDARRRAPVWLRWGLVPFWARERSIGNRMINARAETLADKPAFRQAFRKRRCLIPADGFYEWQEAGKGRPRRPFHVHRGDGAPFCFAGLWERWQGDAEALETCTIVTTEAPAGLATIHPRAPVILEAEAATRWLETPEAEADGLVGLLVPPPEGALVADAVSTTVNDVRNEGPACLAAAPSAEAGSTPATTGPGDLFDQPGGGDPAGADP